MEGVMRRAVGAVEAEVDGERIVLSPKDFSYFRLEGAAGPVWDKIDGARSVDDIVAELETDFDALPDTIRIETVQFISALADAGLVVQER